MQPTDDPTPQRTSPRSSSEGSLGGFPEEDLRLQDGNNKGYFPARLGQTFEDGRFCIIRKLGWGQYSNVWLAVDGKDDRLVSIKILTCEATKALETNSDELGLLRTIATADPSHRGFRYNLLYYDTFRFKGPHGGEHQCIVTEVLGFSLDLLRKLYDDHPVHPSIVKRVTKQILMGLEYLHNECQIIHTDIKHDNILFRPKQLNKVVADQLLKWPSATYDCGSEIFPPVVPVVSQALPPTLDDITSDDELEAVLADFGHSHPRSHHFQEIIQPAALRAPEVILGHEWDTPVDIWNLGCIVVELLVGRWLFKPYPTKEWGYEEDHLARMTEALETQFEREFLDKCKDTLMYFKEDGTFAHFTEHEAPTWTVKKLLESYSLIPDAAERDMAERFILRCLKLTPEHRAAATELLEDSWLQGIQI